LQRPSQEKWSQKKWSQEKWSQWKWSQKKWSQEKWSQKSGRKELVSKKRSQRSSRKEAVAKKQSWLQRSGRKEVVAKKWSQRSGRKKVVSMEVISTEVTPKPDTDVCHLLCFFFLGGSVRRHAMRGNTCRGPRSLRLSSFETVASIPKEDTRAWNNNYATIDYIRISLIW